MNSITLAAIADWCGGVLLQGSPSETVTVLSTDSRKLREGDLFLALKGENFDAHDLLEKAIDAKCSGLVVQSLNAETESFDGAVIHVRDTLVALQMIAAGYRRSLKELRVIGVTGSNGKTSTKDFLGGVFASAGPVNATKGNLNNHIGLPLTILDTNDFHQIGVWEMGMNHPGEIEVLAEIARPDFAVITNVGTAHIEHMKTRDAIAEEKAELAMALSPEGVCFMPVADDYFEFVKKRIACEMISVGIDSGDISASNLVTGGEGNTTFDLSIPGGESASVTLSVSGRHMVMNALLAAAVAWKSGIQISDIADALAAVVLTGGRLQSKSIGGFQILDDTYNANPDSMRAALRSMKEFNLEGRRIAVLGKMGELGEHEESAHKALGADLKDESVDLLITVGDTASLINDGAADSIPHHHFSTHEEAGHFIREQADEKDLILLKGSRSAKMETVLDSLD